MGISCSCLFQGYHHVDDAYRITDLHSNNSDDEVIHHDEKKPAVGETSAADGNKEHHEEEVVTGWVEELERKGSGTISVEFSWNRNTRHVIFLADYIQIT